MTHARSPQGGPNGPKGDGRQRLLAALRRLAAPPPAPQMPKPSDQWGAWVDYRLDQLEDHQTWLLRLLVGALAIQVGLRVLELLQ